MPKKLLTPAYDDKESLGYSDDRKLINLIYKIVLKRTTPEENIDEILGNINSGALSYRKLLLSLILSSEFMDSLSVDAADDYLLFVHNTRLKLIKYILPKGNVILDIGGANGSVIEYGYPHKFKKLILTDIPPESRVKELREVDIQKKWEACNNVEVILTSMMDLSMIQDASIDMVWAGQVVEHVSEEELSISLQEIKRVLKVGGFFCFDTPNSIMARIQSPNKFIHPEHKKEYTPEEMRELVRPHFTIEKELGLAPMPISYEKGEFSYHEVVLNNTFSENLDHSYIMYFMCRK